MRFITSVFLLLGGLTVNAADLPAAAERAADRYKSKLANVLRDAERAKESLFAALKSQRDAAVRQGDPQAAAAIDVLASKAEAQLREIAAAVEGGGFNAEKIAGPVLAASPIEKYLRGCKAQDDYDVVIYAFLNAAVPSQPLMLNLNANHRYPNPIQVRGDWQWDEVMSNERSFYWDDLFPGVIHKAREEFYQRPLNAAECAFANARFIKLKITDILSKQGFGNLTPQSRVLIISNQPQRLQVLCSCKTLVKHPTPVLLQ